MRVAGGRIDLRKYSGMPQRDGSTGRQVDFTKQTHVLVGRRGIPVNESDGKAVLRWRPDLHRQYVGSGLDAGRNVELVGPPRACDFVRISDLLSIEKDICAVVDAAEV